MIFSLSCSSKVFLITGVLVLTIHAQAPLARADDCGLPASLFKDGKPPNQLRDPKCEECKEIMAKLQAAVNDCYAMQLAEADNVLNDSIKPPAGTQQRFQVQRANALKGLGQPADKGAAAKATQKENSAEDAKANKGKSAKDVLKNKIEKLLKELEDCEKNCPEKKEETTTGTPTPTPTPTPPSSTGGGGGNTGQAGGLKPNIFIPEMPKCFDNEDKRNAFFQILDDLRAKENKRFALERNAAAGKKGAKADEPQHDANLKALDDAGNAAAAAPTPCPSPAGGRVPVPPGGGKTPTPTPKEQKSMLPPGPGQEQRNIAPGPPPKDETSGGCKLETTTSPGVVTKTVSVIDNGELVGEVVANLPDNPDGTFTGTVEAKPAGKTDEERARNQAKLNQVVMTVADQQVKPEDKTFTCTVPPATANQPLIVIVNYKNKQIARTSVPARKAQLPQTATNELPWFAQAGRNLVIPHACDGKVDPTDSVKVGGQTLPLVVETQQMRVVRDTSNVLGPTELEFSEQGQITRGPIQNTSVQLSAGKSRLKPNEKTTLKVNVSGMQGITKPVGVEMVNKSAGIVALGGGNTQNVVLQPSDVGPGGSCTKTFTLTGKTPGVFNIKATLKPTTKGETPR